MYQYLVCSRKIKKVKQEWCCSWSALILYWFEVNTNQKIINTDRKLNYYWQSSLLPVYYSSFFFFLLGVGRTNCQFLNFWVSYGRLWEFDFEKPMSWKESGSSCQSLTWIVTWLIRLSRLKKKDPSGQNYPMFLLCII